MKPLHCYEIAFYASVARKGTNEVQARRVRTTVWAEDEEDAVLRVSDALQDSIDRQELVSELKGKRS